MWAECCLAWNWTKSFCNFYKYKLIWAFNLTKSSSDFSISKTHTFAWVQLLYTKIICFTEKIFTFQIWHYRCIKNEKHFWGNATSGISIFMCVYDPRLCIFAGRKFIVISIMMVWKKTEFLEPEWYEKFLNEICAKIVIFINACFRDENNLKQH